MTRIFIIIAALAGLLAVALGAFGAHGLRGQIDATSLAAFNTGVQYQMYHALALLLVTVLMRLFPVRLFPASRLLLWSGAAFIVGIMLFSGSLYGLALTSAGWLGPVTPLGGLSFMLGWLLLGCAALNFKIEK